MPRSKKTRLVSGPFFENRSDRPGKPWCVTKRIPTDTGVKVEHHRFATKQEGSYFRRTGKKKVNSA